MKHLDALKKISQKTKEYVDENIITSYNDLSNRPFYDDRTENIKNESIWCGGYVPLPNSGTKLNISEELWNLLLTKTAVLATADMGSFTFYDEHDSILGYSSDLYEAQRCTLTVSKSTPQAYICLSSCQDGAKEKNVIVTYTIPSGKLKHIDDKFITAPNLIVTMVDGENGLIPDKTFEEIINAYLNGAVVYLKTNDGINLPMLAGTGEGVFFSGVAGRESLIVDIDKNNEINFESNDFLSKFDILNITRVKIVNVIYKNNNYIFDTDFATLTDIYEDGRNILLAYTTQDGRNPSFYELYHVSHSNVNTIDEMSFTRYKLLTAENTSQILDSCINQSIFSINRDNVVRFDSYDIWLSDYLRKDDMPIRTINATTIDDFYNQVKKTALSIDSGAVVNFSAVNFGHLSFKETGAASADIDIYRKLIEVQYVRYNESIICSYNGTDGKMYSANISRNYKYSAHRASYNIDDIDNILENKLNISQGVENSGKILTVGEDGDVTLTEVDLNTESKEITGAINELLAEINALKTEIDSLKSTQESGEM